MFNRVDGVFADYIDTALEVRPSTILPQTGTKNQVVRMFDDGVPSITKVSTIQTFTIVLQFKYISEEDHTSILDFWHDTAKGDGSKRTFYWRHPIDGYRYTVRFMGPLTTSYDPVGNLSINQVTLRVEGTPDKLEIPACIVLPELTGDYGIGATLQCTEGMWTGGGLSYSYQWTRNGIDIPGATTLEYLLAEATSGDVIVCVVTATNLLASTSQPSNERVVLIETFMSQLRYRLGFDPWTVEPPQGLLDIATEALVTTAVITETPIGENLEHNCLSVPDIDISFKLNMSNVTAPEITGVFQEGETLSCSTGTWSVSGSLTYSYQWQANTIDISGATSSTYVLTAGYLSASIACVVTAHYSGIEDCEQVSNSVSA